MTKGFLNDRARYLETYFSRFDGVWYHGDWAHVDADGYWFLHGRSDDTIKVAGKRIGPAEVEAAIVAHPDASEAAAIGVPDDLKGEAIVVFVVLKPGAPSRAALREALSDAVATVARQDARSPRRSASWTRCPRRARPRSSAATIRRRYLGEPVGDLASVENPDAVDRIAHAR